MNKKKVLIILVLLLFLSFMSIQSKAATNTQTVESGVYEIEWVLDNNKVLDISGAETKEGTNVQIWDKCNGKQQRFQITYLSDGYYIIRNINSAKVLDVKGAGKLNRNQYTAMDK